jgi:hypothetical protein
MGWQKCPVCNGKGIITTYTNYNPYGYPKYPYDVTNLNPGGYNTGKCNTCNGRGIINELTGKAVE